MKAALGVSNAGKCIDHMPTPAGPCPLVAGMHQALSNLTSQSATVPPNRDAAIAAAVVAASVAAAEAPRLEPAPPLPLAAAAATNRLVPAGGVHPERQKGDQSCLDRSRRRGAR